MKQTVLFPKNNLAWLAQFECSTLLVKMLALCGSAPVYIVDNNQQVLYWSLGMKELSGLRQEDVVGKPCLPEYAITEAGNSQEQLVKLSGVDGSKIEVKKVVQVLQDKEGAFAGGITLLAVASKPSALGFLPKTSVVNKPDSESQNFQGILSRSPAMRNVFQIISNAAETEVTVLVRGESGAGKELVAKAIHDLSARHSAPFLAINCAALSSNLLESELFGHVRGAFTGRLYLALQQSLNLRDARTAVSPCFKTLTYFLMGFETFFLDRIPYCFFSDIKASADNNADIRGT